MASGQLLSFITSHLPDEALQGQPFALQIALGLFASTPYGSGEVQL